MVANSQNQYNGLTLPLRDKRATIGWGDADLVNTIDVADHGAVGDGVTDDTGAIQEALTRAGTLAGGSTVTDRCGVRLSGKGKIYRATGLIIPSRVDFAGQGATLQANAAGTMATVGTGASVAHMSMIGLGVGTVCEGVVNSGFKARVEDVRFDQFYGSAIRLPVASSRIIDCFAQNCLLGVANLTAPTGVVDLRSTDTWIIRGEFTASRLTMSSTGFACAIAVVGGGLNHIDSPICEISDHGIYVESSWQNRFMSVRADLNMGHGFWLAGGNGSLVGCLASNCGLSADNTYDGFHFENFTSYAVTGCRADSTLASPIGGDANNHRYGFNDLTNSATLFNMFDPTNSSWGHSTAPIKVLDAAGSRVAAIDGPFLDIAAGATTHNVQANAWPSCNWNLKAVGATNFTNFTNGVTGMTLRVRGDGFTTFVHNVSFIRCKSGANTLAAANTLYTFVNVGGIWFEA